MVKQMEVNNMKQAASERRGLRRIFEGFKEHPRYIWTICALVSHISSKRLFVDLNIHYPSHIHLLHLLLASIYVLASYKWRTSSETPLLPTVREAAFLFLFSSITALSVGFTLQATVHFPNPTTLVMLPTISCFIESSILFASGHSKRTRGEFSRLLLILAGCAGICIGEYRWMVKGVVTSIIAVLLAGIARAMHSIATESLPSVVSDSWRLNATFCACAIPITLVFQWSTDQTWSMFWEVVQAKHIPILLVNTISTVAAMVLGKSLLFPVLQSGEDATSPNVEHGSRAADTTTILAFAGVTGITSIFTLRRSYTTWIQLCSFYATILFIGGHSIFDLITVGGEKDGHGYSKLPEPSSFELESEDSERGSRDAISDDTDWSGETTVSSSHESRRRSIHCILLMAVTLTSLWIAFPALNFDDTLHSAPTPTEPVLDQQYNASTPLEIVISMYREPVEDVRYLIDTLRAMPDLQSARVHIYIKDSSADTEHIKKATNANEVTGLPNIGREGETYLNHILSNWDTLARQTFFLQADVHNPREFFPRIHDFFDPKRTGMMSLGWSGHVCDCHSCGDRWMFTDRASLFPAIHSRINNATTCSNVLLSYKGQFVVSAARIRGVPRSVYEDLWDAFVNPESWAHQESYYQDRFDSMDNPYFGFAVERIWNLLFQCSDGDVAWQCPTLLSGWRWGGGKGDCQCFDPV